jgi:hypothetical protein
MSQRLQWATRQVGDKPDSYRSGDPGIWIMAMAYHST